MSINSDEANLKSEFAEQKDKLTLVPETGDWNAETPLRSACRAQHSDMHVALNRFRLTSNTTFKRFPVSS